ncbi:hypothetical protein [Cellulophaga sp. L1A9]|uniref:hypothetical protein n=1 Tax=Cellulophaga sp. L1A9 TaxID=2686362 RepID=UPI00131E05DE|nr:hypothetical protein [Cellulophaga sp. L1A9]
MKNKTTEQLKSNLNTIKGITITLIFAITLLIGVTVYGLLTKEDKSTFISLLTVGISCCAILLLHYINMKKIKSELNLRKLKN